MSGSEVELNKFELGDQEYIAKAMQTAGAKVALVRYKNEWRLCFVETPDEHISFAGIYFYGGRNLKEAIASAERISSKWGWDFVGRLEGGA